jgi:hypothetical protein
MSTPTPRTDAVVAPYIGWDGLQVDEAMALLDLCRTLELELAAARQRDALERRVRELEEAGDKLALRVLLLRELGDGFEELVYAPEPNCSCHISPPCGDCVDYARVRELKAEWKAAR